MYWCSIWQCDKLDFSARNKNTLVVEFQKNIYKFDCYMIWVAHSKKKKMPKSVAGYYKGHFQRLEKNKILSAEWLTTSEAKTVDGFRKGIDEFFNESKINFLCKYMQFLCESWSNVIATWVSKFVSLSGQIGSLLTVMGSFY